MMNEEAVEMLKSMKKYFLPTSPLLDERIEITAIDVAIEALEKQIPKPVRITTSTKRCGRCGRQLSGIGNLHPERNYCTKCGQAIYWG